MMNLLRTVTNTFVRKSTICPARSTSTLSITVPLSLRKRSEPQHRYEPGGYHSVIGKLGWGQYSTVWLVQDTHNEKLVAMKILVGDMDIPDKKGDWDELGILKILRDTNPQSPGYHHVCRLLDDFTLKGPNGNHTCLVLEAMGLSVLDVYHVLRGPMPLPLLKRVSKHLLSALSYLHDECGIIHTDIKGDNILMTGKPLEEGQADLELDEEYLMSTEFKLSDFGAANKMSNRFAQMIQPESLRAPEVIIGAEWDTKADIWNLGCIIYEFARGTKLFDPHWDNENSGMNPPQMHLSQIEGLCGAFPTDFLRRGKKSELYFDDQGQHHLLYSFSCSLLKGAGRYSITIEDLLSRAGHSPEENSEIADFLYFMLIINPKERLSASLLLEHPWLSNVE
ncbi:kinase-like protein [Gymnopilus junonius]|uniref:non-specific serine/threonine protein kinase n=1 Tax=Gymnopilus junonius TaxID=109634 RepID=A0A9P5TPP5_GYMJU|nr:kinase-like protein [Gymnopilus junonius]